MQNGGRSSETQESPGLKDATNDVQIPQENHVKYLGLHLHRSLTWHTHIFSKRKQLGLSLTKMYWLLGRKSKLSTNNKLLIYIQSNTQTHLDIRHSTLRYNIQVKQ
jgi:hypothetical protein